MMPQPAMPSVLEAIDASLKYTGRILFREFDFQKWLAMGFCAFLAGLGEGGGFGGGNPFALKRKDVFPPEFGPWVTGHLPLVIGLGAGIAVFAVALGILITWLGSRGQFMFLDAVVHDSARVSEPWHRYRRLGNSLFVFRLVLGLAGLAALLVVAGGALLLAWPALAAGQFDVRAAVAAAGGLCLLFPLAMVLILVKLMLRDFVVPVMAKRDLTAMEAFKFLRAEILRGRAGAFVRFYLMTFVMAVAAGILITLLTCLTCCIAGLPYISSVVFLPVLVFFRSTSLFFLGQVGEEWRLLDNGGPPAPATPGGPDSPTPPGHGAPQESAAPFETPDAMRPGDPAEPPIQPS